MANTIQIKRRSGISGAPTLAEGELGFDTSANALYIGKSGSNVLTGLPTTGGTLTGLLKINTQGIITTIGSQNANWVHIYNNGEKPFIFNNTVATTSGDLGTSNYQFTDGYIKGTLYLTSTQDASGTADLRPPLIVGPVNAQHIEIDRNEILCKATATTSDTLWLQDGSGTVKVGGTGGLEIPNGSLAAGTDGDTTAERRVIARSGAGTIYLYSQASTSGYRGIYISAHGSGSAKSIIQVDTNNNATFYGSLSGAATSAGRLFSLADIGSGASDHATALKTYFSANKSTVARNALIHFYDSTSGNGSATFGYFLAAHNDDPYGGFFVAHYNNAYYVGISSGTYTQQRLLTHTNYSSYALPIAGGTMTGVLTMKASLYDDAYTGALNMNNSNIYGVNSIYTADVSNNAGEGINFYRDSTHVDTLWMNSGEIYFVPNRALGTGTTAANSQRVARFLYSSSAPTATTGLIWLKPI